MAALRRSHASLLTRLSVVALSKQREELFVPDAPESLLVAGGMCGPAMLVRRRLQHLTACVGSALSLEMRETSDCLYGADLHVLRGRHSCIHSGLRAFCGRYAAAFCAFSLTRTHWQRLHYTHTT